MINLELYRIFKIVADEENLTKASKILHISQPAVTKNIKNLENMLNVQLFKRSKYGMILTDNGKRLYMQIKDSIDILSKSDNMFNTCEKIELGIHINMPSSVYDQVITEHYTQNNSSVINIHKLDAKTMFSMLERQELDLVFSKKYSNDIYDENKIKFINLGYMQDVLVISSKSQYINKKMSKNDLRNVDIYTLKNFSSVHQNLFRALGYSEGDRANIIHINFSGIIELLKHRDIIAAITKEYVKEELEKGELCLLDVDFSLPQSELGVYYNVDNKSKK